MSEAGVLNSKADATVVANDKSSLGESRIRRGASGKLKTIFAPHRKPGMVCLVEARASQAAYVNSPLSHSGIMEPAMSTGPELDRQKLTASRETCRESKVHAVRFRKPSPSAADLG